MGDCAFLQTGLVSEMVKNNPSLGTTAEHYINRTKAIHLIMVFLSKKPKMRFKEFMEFVFKLSRTVRLAKDEHDVITGKSRCNIHKHQYSFELYNFLPVISRQL